MTRKEYEEYEESFRDGVSHVHATSSGLCPGCTTCAESHGIEQSELDAGIESGKLEDEPHFSWRSCDVCDSLLGGDRYAFHGLDVDNALMHLDVCCDCVYYAEYGQLDDMTMSEITNE